MKRQRIDLCQAVAYIRVSTKKQGQSGLGLEAQQATIAAWLAQSGCKLLATYSEVESGSLSRQSRVELDRALKHTKRTGATLVVAKLDRLSRDSVAIETIRREAGEDFNVVFCDMPHIPKGSAGNMMVRMVASQAQYEREVCSERTKAALGAAKARGVRLGNPANLSEADRVKGRLIGAAKNRSAFLEDYKDELALIRQWALDGLGQQAIADRLNREGYTTRTGVPFRQGQVSRLMDRAGITRVKPDKGAK